MTSTITTFEDGKEIIRGTPLETLVRERSFVETIYFLHTGVFPSKEYETMLNAMFVSAIDHGTEVLSAQNARAVAAEGKATYESLAAGILGFSPQHGIAGEAAMKFFYAELPKYKKETSSLQTTLADMKARGERVSGYGHRIFTDSDPRTVLLFDIAKEQGIYGEYCDFALTVKDALNLNASKPLPLNIDGAFGAILCDMGLKPHFGQVFFLIARTPGLLAHIVEVNEHNQI